MTVFTARSASDRTDEWPFWMVWDGHVNVTGRVFEKLTGVPAQGAVFTSREHAQLLAAAANKESGPNCILDKSSPKSYKQDKELPHVSDHARNLSGR